MARVDHQDPNNPLWYRKTAVPEYIADDRIWFWAMGTARVHDECIWRGEVLSSANDIAVVRDRSSLTGLVLQRSEWSVGGQRGGRVAMKFTNEVFKILGKQGKVSS